MQQQQIRTMLASSSFDYDALNELLRKHESEKFDVLVRLAFELSEMNLTVPEAKRASRMIANLAVTILTFNFSQTDNAAEVTDAAADAYQRV